MEQHFRIINLKAENIKRLVAIDITPDERLVKITGKNGHGKTSVLDCIWWCLGGAANIQSQPIRTGEESAYITIDLGEIKATRTFKYNKKGEITTKLEVEGEAGSPQAIIDKILGDLTFDPLEFSRKDKKTQFEILRKFVPDVDFEKIESDNKTDYDKRRDINRQAKEKSAAAEQIKVDIKTAPTDMIDVSKLANDINSASERNNEIKNLEDEGNRIKQEIKEREELLTEISKELTELGQQVDLTEMKSSLDGAQAHNDLVKSRQDKVKLIEEASRLNQESERLTRIIEQRNKEKEDAVKNANLPVSGISFGDNEIMLNNQPFDQASDAEKLKASMAIAMALNPKLRVIRVRDGSLLDDESMAEIQRMAEENDFYVWIEIVDGSGKVGFVIEEGQLKNTKPQEIEEWD